MQYPNHKHIHNAMVNAGFVDTRQLAKVSSDYTYTTNDWYGAQDSLIDYVWIYQPKTKKKNDQQKQDDGSDNIVGSNNA